MTMMYSTRSLVSTHKLIKKGKKKRKENLAQVGFGLSGLQDVA
jgi:hypothetical protein